MSTDREWLHIYRPVAEPDKRAVLDAQRALRVLPSFEPVPQLSVTLLRTLGMSHEHMRSVVTPLPQTATERSQLTVMGLETSELESGRAICRVLLAGAYSICRAERDTFMSRMFVNSRMRKGAHLWNPSLPLGYVDAADVLQEQTDACRDALPKMLALGSIAADPEDVLLASEQT